MSDIYTGPKAFYSHKPAVQFFEDGEWMRVEDQSIGIRYLKKQDAIAIMLWIGQHSQKDKTDLILI